MVRMAQQTTVYNKVFVGNTFGINKKGEHRMWQQLQPSKGNQSGALKACCFPLRTP